MRPTRRGSRASTAASTSRPTTSPDGASGRRSESGPGRSPSATSPAPLADGSAAGANLQPARDSVERDREQEDDAGDDVDRPGLVARGVEAVRDRRDHECADERAAHLATAAEQARAADNRSRDRIE